MTETIEVTAKLCRCGCGSETGKVFTVGHDARYKGVLARRFNDADEAGKAVVLQECDEIDGLYNRTPGKWRELIQKQSGNITREKLRQAGSSRKPVTERQRHERKLRKQVREGVLDPDVLDNSKSDYMDSLMERLNRNPRAGQVGWLRLPEDKSNRMVAKVWKTERDKGIELIWVKIVDGERDGEIVQIHPDCWIRDEELERP